VAERWLMFEPANAVQKTNGAVSPVRLQRVVRCFLSFLAVKFCFRSKFNFSNNIH
jgi:hypothetical protein